jgi:hypothetical protein
MLRHELQWGNLWGSFLPIWAAGFRRIERYIDDRFQVGLT